MSKNKSQVQIAIDTETHEILKEISNRNQRSLVGQLRWWIQKEEKENETVQRKMEK